MSLLKKMRVLVGAWVHKPFTPRPEKIQLEEESSPTQQSPARREQPALATQWPEAEGTERVADLIAQQRHGEKN